MKNAKEIRREHLRRLLRNYSSQRQFADAVGLSAAHVSQMLTGAREVGDQVARRIEAALSMRNGFIDQEIESPTDADKRVFLDELLSSDQLKLIKDYMLLSDKHREVVRETAAAYVLLERDKRGGDEK